MKNRLKIKLKKCYKTYQQFKSLILSGNKNLQRKKTFFLIIITFLNFVLQLAKLRIDNYATGMKCCLLPLQKQSAEINFSKKK